MAVLEPDVAAVFASAGRASEVLRALAGIIQKYRSRRTASLRKGWRDAAGIQVGWVRGDRFRTSMSSVILWRRDVMESSFAKWNWLQAAFPCFRNGAHMGRGILGRSR